MSRLTDDVKTLLKGSIDDRLDVIERRTKGRLASLLGVDSVPPEFDDISYEVTLKRFNRIGQEGMQSYTQEGLSMAFPDSDFSEYQSEIDSFRDKDKGLLGPKKGGFRFI
ncbi:MAG: phage head-tail connector protein [Vagococcus sp.]